MRGASVANVISEHDTISNPVDLDGIVEDTVEDEPTSYRGDKPPRASSSRRLSPTLMRVFKRRREQIGLTVAQVARLAGIEEEELSRFEGTGGNHRLYYDHVVVLARVLGVRPQDLPGLRPRETKDAQAMALHALGTALSAGAMLVFEGKSGERFGGDLERLGTVPDFGLRIGDGSLAEHWPRGALLAFVTDTQPKKGDVVILRHKKTRQLLLRRLTPSSWAGLAEWQPSYPAPSAEWLPIARLAAVLPRP
jgi:hypothetical protein